MNNNVNLAVDVKLDTKEMDTIGAGSLINSGDYKINVSQMNVLSDALGVETSIPFADSVLKDSVTTTISEVAYSPIYKYDVSYNQDNGEFLFLRSGGSSGSNFGDYNPALMAAPVAAQMGGYLSQLNSYEQAFKKMDMYMLLTKNQRLAMKYAATETRLPFVMGIQRDTMESGGWGVPYTTLEKAGLKGGTKVNNTAYGTFAGVDSEIYELGGKWDGILSVYAGYNGSHQSYLGNSIQQNGGNIGVLGILYHDDFFAGLTLNYGSSIADASTMYGSEDFTMIMAGAALKTGYNKEFKDGKFIIQPSLMTSYTMVNTFDYTSASGVRVKGNPLHAIQIEPSIRFIFNTDKGWQPYLGLSGVWNIMDDTHFKANDVTLPELSVKPYAKYGFGLRKKWGDKCTGFIQAFFTSGGRSGVGLQAGFKWTLGKNTQIRPPKDEL